MIEKKTRDYIVKTASLSEEGFHDILNQLGLSKKQLAKNMGLAYSTVLSWFSKNNETKKKKGMPMYAQRYLEMVLELQKYKTLHANVKTLYADMHSLKQTLNELDVTKTP